MLKLRLRFAVAAVLLLAGISAWAGDYLFVNPVYLSQTKEVLSEANEKAPMVFHETPDALARYNNAARQLADQVDDTQRKLYFKKAPANALDDVKDKAFADALNAYKDALNALSDAAEQPLEKLLPGYAKWTQVEITVVKAGLDQRLQAYETRFGPGSEPINLVELLISQKLLPGDEAGPAPWEPILRFSAVQITSRGTGLTSTAEAGMNYYFVKGAPPKPLQWLTVSNHVGVAAVMEYLDDPGVLKLKGRPSFGLMVHADRKEIGVVWDKTQERFRLTVGYAFQFIPMIL